MVQRRTSLRLDLEEHGITLLRQIASHFRPAVCFDCSQTRNQWPVHFRALLADAHPLRCVRRGAIVPGIDVLGEDPAAPAGSATIGTAPNG
jgi:hypothetical protein